MWFIRVVTQRCPSPTVELAPLLKFHDLVCAQSRRSKKGSLFYEIEFNTDGSCGSYLTAS